MRSSTQFVICIKPDAGIDLEIGKVYQAAPAEKNDPEDMIRVVDESGDDYLYPASYFVPVEVTEDSAQALEESLRARSRATG